MARSMSMDHTEFFRCLVTYERGQHSYDGGFEPQKDSDGEIVRGTSIFGPYTTLGVTRARSRAPYYHSRLIEKRIQRLAPVAVRVDRTDQFGNQESEIVSELRWVDM